MGRGAVALPAPGQVFPAWPVRPGGGPPQGTHVKPRGPAGTAVAGVRYAWLAQYCASASVGGRRSFRCISRAVLYQCTQALVIFSTSPRVASEPSRNGDPSRTHSDSYSPMVVSARALS